MICTSAGTFDKNDIFMYLGGDLGDKRKVLGILHLIFLLEDWIASIVYDVPTPASL